MAPAPGLLGRAGGVSVALEVSQSGEGAHVWIFFFEPAAAADARALGAALLCEAMAIRGELGLESYDRFFPAQDFMPKKGFGNLIALPLQGRCRRRSGTTVFLSPETLEPHEDQFAFLSSIRPLSAADVLDKVQELQPPEVGPATSSSLGGASRPPPGPERGEVHAGIQRHEPLAAPMRPAALLADIGNGREQFALGAG